MIAATVVGLQSVPGLVILYGSIVKKKWAVNSAFMALYAFAAVILCWVTWAYNMSFGEKLVPFWGKATPALGQQFLMKQTQLPATTHYFQNGTVQTALIMSFFPMASMEGVARILLLSRGLTVGGKFLVSPLVMSVQFNQPIIDNVIGDALR
ncbi:ammonium transporter 3 member 2-like [Apium graveolens]|uniref:ammonium transporter 3 member 2-like n=1 Tax=Apium graveolens TaxID=4045 RepID=UPI003D791257